MLRRYLIVNGDDFGLSDGINRGIVEAAESGILTSASLMVRQPTAPDAAAAARRRLDISVGLHVDLGEWVLRQGEWVPLYSVVPTDNASAVAREVSDQLKEFRRLMDRDPTHLDSHQHVHRSEPVRSIVLELGARLRIPVRECTDSIRYCGDFYGQGLEGESLPDILSVDGLKKILCDLPNGFTELGCHPGYGDGLLTPYRDERVRELAVLCSPDLRGLLHELGICLCNFKDLARIQTAAC